MNIEREIIKDLAAGFTVRCEGGGGWDADSYFMDPPGRYEVLTERIQSLISGGWIERLPNGSGFRFTDDGRKAYLKSTDEMGDGKLIAPALQQQATE